MKQNKSEKCIFWKFLSDNKGHCNLATSSITYSVCDGNKDKRNCPFWSKRK